MGVIRHPVRRPERALAPTWQHVEPINPVIQSIKPRFQLLFGLSAQLPSQFRDFFRSGLFQAVLLTLMSARFRQGSFAPPALPGFNATMNPSDSRPGRRAVIYSRRASSPTAPAVGGTKPGLPSFVDNLSMPAVLSHPGEPLRCTCSLLGGRCWLRRIRSGGRSHMCNEAETGLLALRLTSSLVAGFAAAITRVDAARATCVTSNSHGELLSVHKITPTYLGAPDDPDGHG